MKKAIFIVGPTAVGKTDLAFKISKKIPSALISADSIQVYKGADIISGKDKTIHTELLDVFPPDKPFSVQNFVESVRSIVKKAKKDQKVPIIVGGTGFYIDALFGKIDTISIPPNKKLRISLEKLTVKDLQKRLKKINPKRFKSMNNSDINNKRRLIRAIEVGSNVSRFEQVFSENEVLIIGLKTSFESLKKRMVARVVERIKMGALDEARRLYANYKLLSPQIKTAAGYRQLFDFLEGKTTFEEAVKKWKIAEGQLAKKQMTWFRRNKNIRWFDIENEGFEREIMEMITHKIGL